MNATRQKRERGTGSIYQRGNRWWIEYWGPGGRVRESAGDSEAEAKRKLKDRIKEIAGGRYVGPAEERLTVPQLCDNLILHLKTKGAKAIPSFESHLKPIRGGIRVCASRGAHHRADQAFHSGSQGGGEGRCDGEPGDRRATSGA